MTIEQMLVQYLYSTKKLSLQNIGEFTLTSDVVIPSDLDTNVVLPENSIDFKYNAHADSDTGLVDFIVQNSKKIKSLASSDLESYTALNKQFLNIGKPYSIDGIGTLHKLQDGNYSFEQATASQQIAKENVKTEKVKNVEKAKEKINFSSPKKEQTNSNISKVFVLGLLSILLLGALGYGGYYLFKNFEANKTENEKIVATKKIEAEKASKDSITNAITAIVKDSNNFYVVIKEFQNFDIAKMRLNKLLSYGNNVALSTKDSVVYKLRMPFKLSLTDTLKVKDSLAKFFQAKTYVELP